MSDGDTKLKKFIQVKVVQGSEPPIVLLAELTDNAAEKYRLMQAEELMRRAGFKRCRSRDGGFHWVRPSKRAVKLHAWR